MIIVIISKKLIQTCYTLQKTQKICRIKFNRSKLNSLVLSRFESSHSRRFIHIMKTYYYYYYYYSEDILLFLLLLFILFRRHIIILIIIIHIIIQKTYSYLHSKSKWLSPRGLPQLGESPPRERSAGPPLRPSAPPRPPPRPCC